MNICLSCGLVVDAKWPWLGASLDLLISDKKESVYGAAVEVKCSSSNLDSSLKKSMFTITSHRETYKL